MQSATRSSGHEGWPEDWQAYHSKPVCLSHYLTVSTSSTAFLSRRSAETPTVVSPAVVLLSNEHEARLRYLLLLLRRMQQLQYPTQVIYRPVRLSNYRAQ